MRFQGGRGKTDSGHRQKDVNGSYVSKDTYIRGGDIFTVEVKQKNTTRLQTVCRGGM